MKRVILCTFLFVFVGCASVPVHLTQPAQVAFKKHEVQKDLDLLRDVAVDANAAHVLSDPMTRAIVEWHESALKIIHDTSDWQSSLTVSLTELRKNVHDATLDPYFALALSVLKGFAQ